MIMKNPRPVPTLRVSMPTPRRRQFGFSLIELMVAITISLLVVAGLGVMLVNLSSANRELSKANDVIENGRFAIQVLQDDAMHAGFWGGFTPQFDDHSLTLVPTDVPTAVPDPCQDYTTWNDAYKDNLLGIPVQSYSAAPTGCSSVVTNKKANTDVLVVRHAERCIAGASNCDANTSGKLYIQNSLCSAGTAGLARGATATTITLQAPGATSTTSLTNNVYSGMIIRTTGGTGAGQSRTISAYSGTTNIATISTAWATVPDATTTYAIMEYILSASTNSAAFSLHQRGANCATAAVTPLRKFVSNIYYIRDYSVTPGDNTPTLMRSTFDPTGAPALAHQAPVALVENIEGLAVEVGIDNTMTRCTPNTPVNYAAAVNLVDPATCTVQPSPNTSLNTLPTNRGDGMPDSFIRCPAASCTAAQLTNAVAVKLYVLARSAQTTPGHTDTKTYCLAARDAAGTCANSLGPFNDGYRRHVFSTTVRLVDVSGRRESP